MPVRLLKTIALLIACTSTFAGHPGGTRAVTTFEITQSGFEVLKQGVFSNAGQNLYVSAQGRIQFVHRWDLNNDGYYDLVFNNTHNRVDVPDAFLYLQSGGGYRSAISSAYDLLPLYEKWRQEEISRPTLQRLAGLAPSQMVISDLDRDGHPEVILANTTDGFSYTSTSYIYWGGPDGYRRRTDLPTHTASGVCVGDLNRDGYPDVVFSNKGRGSPAQGGYRDHLESYIYWGAAGGYSAERRTSVPTISAVSCTLGDLDGDGQLDLTFANSESDQSSLYVYWGTVRGPDVKQRTTLTIPNPRQVRFYNVNPSGKCLYLTGKAGVTVLRSSGDRTLTRVRHIDIAAWAAAAGDLDGDGSADLVLATDSGGQVLWSGQDWNTARATTLPALAPQDVLLADLDIDGRYDIVLANNHSERTYDVPSYIYWGNPNGYGLHRRSELQTFGAVAVAAADVNSDGRADLAFANNTSGFVSGPDRREDSLVYWGAPHRGYSAANVTRYPTNAAMGSSLADLDDDGHTELLFANMADDSFLYRGTPMGPSREKLQKLLFPGSEPHNSFETADLNRDGFLDVLLCTRVHGDSGGCVMILWGGSSGFSERNSTAINYDLKGVGNIRLADLNVDGWLDLFLSAGYDTQSAILWGGREGFSMSRSTMVAEPYVGNVEFADLNDDGYLDLILCKVFDPGELNVRAGSRIRIYYGGPAGLLNGKATELPVTGALDIVVADLNHDRALDIGVAQYSGGPRADLPFPIFWNDGQGRFSAGNRDESLPGNGGTGGLVSDFDYDGLLDLLVLNHNDRGNHNINSYLYLGIAPGLLTSGGDCASRGRTPLGAKRRHRKYTTRRPEESYISTPIAVPAGVRKFRILPYADTPLDSRVEMFVRLAPARDALARAPWEAASDGTVAVAGSHSWLQYRAVLVAGRGGATPYLTGVTIKEME